MEREGQLFWGIDLNSQVVPVEHTVGSKWKCKCTQST